MAQRRRSGRRPSGREQPLLKGVPGAQPGAGYQRRRPPTASRKIPRPLLIAVGAVIIGIVALVVVNYWISVKRPSDAPILQVNSRIFTWNDYVSLLKFQKLGAESLGQKFDAGSGPYGLMQTMAENELIRQAASREGLSVTQDQLNKEMMSRLLPTPTDPNDKAEAAQAAREFGVALSNYMATVQLSRADYEQIVRADLFRDQLRTKLGEKIPRVQSQANLFLIKVADADTEKTKKALATSEFTAVARRSSTDDSKENGGEVGWTPRLVYKELDEILFGLREGQISEPVQGKDGWWIIRITSREGDKARIQGVFTKDGGASRDAQKRLESGFSFADVVTEFSTDADNKAKKGELGLLAIGDYGGVFDQAIRGLPLGKTSDAVGTTDGAFFVRVTERTGAREVSDKHFDVLKTRALEDWIRREWDANKVDYCPGGKDDCFSNTKVDLALAQIKDVSLTKAQEAATATVVAAAKAQQQRQQPSFG